MRDVSVRVGGLNGAAVPGTYASAFNHSGEVNSEGGQMVMVENYSQLPFQIGRELIPPMYRKTFGLDNYPKLQWSVTGQVANPANFIGFSETRTVRIIIDPVIVQTDGPVYPDETLTCISGMISLAISDIGGYPPFGLTASEFMIDVYSLLAGFLYEPSGSKRGGGGTTVIPAAVLDPAIMKFEFFMPTELQVKSNTDGTLSNSPLLKYCSLPPAVYLAVGAGAPLTKFFDLGGDFPGGFFPVGRDILVRTKVPGASLIIVKIAGSGLPTMVPGLIWRAWVGWHL